MFTQFGLAELLILCLVGIMALGLPAATLVLLFVIHGRLKRLEALLQNKR